MFDPGWLSMSWAERKEKKRLAGGWGFFKIDGDVYMKRVKWTEAMDRRCGNHTLMVLNAAGHGPLTSMMSQGAKEWELKRKM
jgi:hypothetical protein